MLDSDLRNLRKFGCLYFDIPSSSSSSSLVLLLEDALRFSFFFYFFFFFGSSEDTASRTRIAVDKSCSVMPNSLSWGTRAVGDRSELPVVSSSATDMVVTLAGCVVHQLLYLRGS